MQWLASRMMPEKLWMALDTLLSVYSFMAGVTVMCRPWTMILTVLAAQGAREGSTRQCRGGGTGNKGRGR